MAQLHQSMASLRIIGDDLDPEEISLKLGCQPSSSQRKGDELIGKETGIIRIVKCGMWCLDAVDCEPENLDLQVEEILTNLTPDLSVWAALSEKYVIDLFCGFFMEKNSEGLSVSAKTLKSLGERGIELEVCIYAPIQEVKENDLCPCDSGKKYAQCCMPKHK